MPDILLPADKPTRARVSYNPEFITLDEAESLALATGQCRGMTVTFSDDGHEFVDAWVPSEDHPHHPEYAKAIVTRKLPDGDVVVTPSILRWVEYVPDMDSSRYADWDKMPTVMLGKCAKVSSYRGGFRDVIGNRYEPAELDHVQAVAA